MSFWIVFKNEAASFNLFFLHLQHDDLGPLHIKIQSIIAQIEELAANIKSDQQLWMKRQGILMGLTQTIQANSKELLKLQAEYTGWQQTKLYFESMQNARAAYSVQVTTCMLLSPLHSHTNSNPFRSDRIRAPRGGWAGEELKDAEAWSAEAQHAAQQERTTEPDSAAGERRDGDRFHSQT